MKNKKNDLSVFAMFWIFQRKNFWNIRIKLQIGMFILYYRVLLYGNISVEQCLKIMHCLVLKIATVLYYMSVTFGLPILVRFLSDPWFIHWYSCFLLHNIYSVFHCRLSPVVSMENVRGMRIRRGREGSHKWQKIVRGCAREIILVHH